MASLDGALLTPRPNNGTGTRRRRLGAVLLARVATWLLCSRRSQKTSQSAPAEARSRSFSPAPASSGCQGDPSPDLTASRLGCLGMRTDNTLPSAVPRSAAPRSFIGWSFRVAKRQPKPYARRRTSWTSCGSGTGRTTRDPVVRRPSGRTRGRTSRPPRVPSSRPRSRPPATRPGTRDLGRRADACRGNPTPRIGVRGAVQQQNVAAPRVDLRLLPRPLRSSGCGGSGRVTSLASTTNIFFMMVQFLSVPSREAAFRAAPV